MILGIDASQANRQIRSGTEWYAFYLIQEFKKLIGQREDIRVRLYLKDELQADLSRDLPANFQVKILKWPFHFFWGQIRLSWEMLVNPPDILFCPAHTIPLIHPRSPLPTHPHQGEGNKKENSFPLVGELRRGGTYTTLHDIGFEDNPELYDKLSLWYHRWSAKFAVKHAARIFTISEFSRKRITERYTCPPEKISVIHLGIDQNLTIVKDWSILEKYGLQRNDYILFIGRLEPKKNIFETIKAFERLISRGDMPQVLVLAGRKVNTKVVDEYLRSRPELKKRVKFLGYVKEEDKPALYSGAAVFLFPTLYEGFGLPILEAQAAGTPVVTSNVTSNPEVAGVGAVLVNPRNVEEIAAAVSKLLADPGLRERMITLGLENVKRFSWSSTARLTLEKMGI